MPVCSGPSSCSERRGALLAFLAAWLVAMALAAGAYAETRVALVIGNGDYARFETLENPTNDATDIAGALEGLGFEVMFGTDLGRTAMTDLVGRFATAAREADVALFFYAGHGFQIDRQNYLVPVDAEIGSRAEVDAATVRLDEITRELEAGDGIRLVFLDACRNNPLPPEMAAAPGEPRGGLAQVGDAAGFLFAFATQPDNVAYDGIGRNSFFTRALLGHLGTPGQDIATMMIEVRKDVLAATGGRQVPWENSSLTRQFAFAAGDEPLSADTMLWQVAATAQDPHLLRLYVDRYPEGAHQTDALEMLASMTSAWPGEAGPARDLPPPTSATLADSLWELARRSRQRPLLEAYLAHAPDGPHAAEARRMLAVLPRTEAPELRCETLATHPHDATATTAGVPLVRLARQARAAIEACRAAAAAHPDMPHYTALLARATFASGDLTGAAGLYRDAADRGDLRAMFSLARMLETGTGVPKDEAAAAALYERSAAGGNEDSAINLAAMLTDGPPALRDPERALALFQRAADAGSAIATFNLGALAYGDGRTAEALGHFRRAAELGEPRAYLEAALVLDEGAGVPRDPRSVADLLLRGVASDFGQAYDAVTGKATALRPDTIRALQELLKAEGFYAGALDGISGPLLAAALLDWRRGGHLVAGR